MSEYDFPEKTLEGIIKKAIKEGKLFELLFTEEGRRLWMGWPERRVKEMVQKALKRMEK